MISSVFGSPWTERKRKIFVLESRNANERPKGLEKKIARNAFVGSPSFLCRGGNDLDYRECMDGNDFCLSSHNRKEERNICTGVSECQ